MSPVIALPSDFAEHLDIRNAAQRFAEALRAAEQVAAAGVPMMPNPDHAAIFTDPSGWVVRTSTWTGTDVPPIWASSVWPGIRSPGWKAWPTVV